MTRIHQASLLWRSERTNLIRNHRINLEYFQQWETKQCHLLTITGIAVDSVKHIGLCIHINTNASRTSKHQTSLILPALDGTAAVGMELTATEGARDDTGVAVDDV